MSKLGSDVPGSEVMYPSATDGDGSSRALVPAPPFGPAASPFGAFAGAPRGPEILTGGFNQTWLVNCLRRRWLPALLLGLLVGAGTAGLLMYLFPESSRVTAYLQIKSETSEDIFADERRIVNPLTIERESMTHMALMKSPFVIEEALRDRDISQLDAVTYYGDEAVLWLLDDLKVSFPTEGEILEVRYEGDESPDDMVKIVDAIIAAYKTKVLYQDRIVEQATKEDLETVLTKTKTDLKRDLDAYQEKSSLNNYENFAEFELPKLKSDIQLYQTQLLLLKKEEEDITVMRDLAVQSARSPAALAAAVSATVDADPRIAMYQQKLFDLDQLIEERRAASRNPANAELRRLAAQRDAVSQQMGSYRAEAERIEREKLEKFPSETLRNAVVEYNIRAQSIAQRRADFEQKIKEADARITEMSVADPEMEMLSQKIESQQELIKSLELKINEWRVQRWAADTRPDQATDFEKVRIIQPAVATPQINKYERWAIAGIGGAAALCLTCYGIALFEFRRRRLNGPSDVDEGLGVRVLGVLPATSLKALTGNSLVATQVAEAIDNVRATIMHDSTSRPRQVVMVTSPASMEGSTTVASSLALSLARAGRRTLLVDGDLRAPSLHKLFGMPLEDGLSEVLRAETDLFDAVRPTNSSGLYLMTAGNCDMDAIHALATDQPQAIFEKLRDQFDFVVIDAPPVLGISDSLSLGQYIDGAILCVLRDQSEIRKVHQAVEVLRSLGIRLIGSVVNGMPVKADRRVMRLHQNAAQRQPRLPAAPAATKSAKGGAAKAPAPAAAAVAPAAAASNGAAELHGDNSPAEATNGDGLSPMHDIDLEELGLGDIDLNEK